MERCNSVMVHWFSSIYVGSGKGNCLILVRPPLVLWFYGRLMARFVGVKNLQTLTTTIANQKLGYQFPYSSFDLETDLNFVLISEGKSFVPVRSSSPLNLFSDQGGKTTCIVQVRPEEPTVHFVPPTKSQLDLFRSFLHTYRLSDFSIPSHMSEVRSFPDVESGGLTERGIDDSERFCEPTERRQGGRSDEF